MSLESLSLSSPSPTSAAMVDFASESEKPTPTPPAVNDETVSMASNGSGNGEPKAGLLLEDIIAKVEKTIMMDNHERQDETDKKIEDSKSPTSLDAMFNTDDNNNIEHDQSQDTLDNNEDDKPGTDIHCNTTHTISEIEKQEIDNQSVSQVDQQQQQSTSECQLGGGGGETSNSAAPQAVNDEEEESSSAHSLPSKSCNDSDNDKLEQQDTTQTINRSPIVSRSDSHSSSSSSSSSASSATSFSQVEQSECAIEPMLQVNSRPSSAVPSSTPTTASMLEIKSEPESPPPLELSYHPHHSHAHPHHPQSQAHHHLGGHHHHLVDSDSPSNPLHHQHSHNSNSNSSHASSHLNESLNSPAMLVAPSTPSTGSLAGEYQQSQQQQHHNSSPLTQQQQLNLSTNSLLCPPPGLGAAQQQQQQQQQQSQAQFHPQQHHAGHHGLHSHHQLGQTSLLGPMGGGQVPAQPAVSAGGVSIVASSSPSSDQKEGIEEACPVCGDRVSGYHYGLLTCESCKGFFKRTVQNKKVYTCVADRSCHIDKSQRKRCPYCRFQKCLDVGMKLEAVRADRMRGGRNKFGPMYKRDRARRLQMIRQKQLTKVAHGGLNGLSGATILPGGLSVDRLGFATPGAGGGHLFDGIKQELIQIPQLSSSTSSPDSSPSPGLAAAVAAAAAAAAAASGAANGQASNVLEAHHFGLQMMQNAAAASGQQQQQQQQQQLGSMSMSLGAPSVTMTAGTGTDYRTATVAGSSQLSGNGSGRHGYDGSKALLAAQQQQTTLPPLIRELQSSMPDDKEWQIQLFGLLQNQTYNQCEVDLFELMCKVIDQSLFAQVDWARNSIFFKDLKVDDQMKLLQHAWSDMLMLDHLHQRLHVGLPDETTLPNGQKFDLLALALLGVTESSDQLHTVTARLSELKLDPVDYICLKFLLLLNPEVRQLNNVRLVNEAHEQTKQALHQYTLTHYPQNPNKFHQLLSLVPEIRQLTVRGEDFLYYRHMSGQAPNQTLLMEMLHAKKK